jgi:hypothetical protein
MCTGLVWLRIWTESSSLCGNEPAGFHEVLGGSQASAHPVASRVVLSSVKLVFDEFEINYSYLV